MKMKNNKLAELMAVGVMTLLSASSMAHAQGGDKIGGGGDILTCKEGRANAYYLLDLYEAKDRGYKSAFANSSMTMEQMLASAMSTYGSLDPVRANQYLKEAAILLQDIRALDQGLSAPNKMVAYTSIRLRDIDDADEVLAPENCMKDQMVRQDFSKDAVAPYVIYRPLFNKLDESQKVATLLHEVIYKDFRANGATKSKAARYLNARIVSNEINSFSQKDYFEFLKENHLMSYLFAGKYEVLGSMPTPTFDSTGQIVSLNQDLIVQVGQLKFLVSNTRFDDGQLMKASSLNAWIEINGILATKKTDVPLYYYEKFGGDIVFNPDSTVSILNVKKGSDAGFINYLIDQEGKILKKEETGYYRQGLSSDQEAVLNSLFSCLKKASLRQSDQYVSSFIENARTAIGKNDLSELKKVANSCENQEALSPSTVISPEAQLITQWIVQARLKQKKKELISCSGFNIGAQAEAIFGVEAGITTNLTCTYYDGSRRVYAGFNLGFMVFGIGAEARAGKIEYKDGESKISGPFLITLSEESSQGVLVGYHKGHVKAFEGDHRISGMDSSQHRIGFSAADTKDDFNFLFRVAKRHDRYDHLLNKITEKIMIQLQ